ncbi:UDP-N-acetylglucosamine 4,6-dehydratase family protein [Porphyromonas levii]|uniref:Polysaccharide biosynthesis protein n=2 Tax=Porphyromonas levii TaxID=28114 RepID=A0A4Y8WNM6_9PORP|nr:nucleoside-diphosphate sugar epimerase/dehydratase [Porphyromonas levii]TFH94510.1 polysaccharide biosynthesis protein [Porphyromonas levii]TFH97013.1 polysaccharide biosynthesis protein [Porphyromonas levii]
MANQSNNEKKGFNKVLGNHVINRLYILLADALVGLLAGVVSLYAFELSTYLVDTTLHTVLLVAISGFIATLVSSFLFGTYRQLMRYQVFAIGKRVLLMLLLNALIFALIVLAYNAAMTMGYNGKILLTLAVNYFVVFFVAYILYRSFIILVARRLWFEEEPKANSKERLLIYGVDMLSSRLVARFEGDPHYQLLGFCKKHKQGSTNATIGDFSVYQVDDMKEFSALVKRLNIDGILFTSKRDLLRERDSFVYELAALGVKSLYLPEIGEHSATDIAREAVQRIEMEDLLQRDVIRHEQEKVNAMYRGKVVMVTGAAGSIGSELVMQIAALGVKQLLLLDLAETPLHNVRLRLQRKFPKLDFVPILGDVRSQKRLDAIFTKYKPEIVLHAAAYKHVPLLEENPCEGVMANVQGSKNMADFCLKYGVERMVMVSTDKAVNPTNVLGASKRAAEIYVQALGKAVEGGKVEGKTTFITTRFGNVLGSQGSVIPLFREQIAKGGPITVTDPEINRFFMSIREACSLILEASSVAKETTIFVFDMGEPHKIVDLAENMVRLAGLEPYKDIDIVFTGLRPGEKLYEEKLADGENTIPTDIPKIHIARVREHNYADLYDTYEQLRDHARKVQVTECVALLKALIPEYISAPNSPFASLDTHRIRKDVVN